jgi:hypothetical protein
MPIQATAHSEIDRRIPARIRNVRLAADDHSLVLDPVLAAEVDDLEAEIGPFPTDVVEADAHRSSLQDGGEVGVRMWRIADADHRAPASEGRDGSHGLRHQAGGGDQGLPHIAALVPMLYPVGLDHHVQPPPARLRGGD